MSKSDLIQVVRVDGLKELLTDLRKVDKKLARKTTTKIKRAAEIVADDARERMPHQSGTAAASVKAGTSGAKAFVREGKDDVPYVGWLDFGTRNAQPSRAPWANSGKGPEGGRFIYPALAANADEVTNQVRKAVDEALNEVNL